jgi:hypothetical protein
VRRALGIDSAKWSELERQAFEDLSLVLALIPDLRRWTDNEKREVISIIRAKMSADELPFLRLLQRHAKLRDAIRRLGSV